MALERAYELGRRAIADGLGVLDIAAQFFAEGIAPFEMTFRGFQESITKLHDLNKTLEQSELKFRSVVHAANDAIISSAGKTAYRLDSRTI